MQFQGRDQILRPVQLCINQITNNKNQNISKLKLKKHYEQITKYLRPYSSPRNTG